MIGDAAQTTTEHLMQMNRLLLAIGTDADPDLSARHFLETLVHSLDLDAAVFWFDVDELPPGAAPFGHHVCFPQDVALRAYDLLTLLEPALTIAEPEQAARLTLIPGPAALSAARLPVGDLGFIELHSPQEAPLFSAQLAAFKPVFEHFARSMAALLGQANRVALLPRLNADLRYRALFEQSNDAIFLIGLDGAFIACNERAASMLGLSHAADLLSHVSSDFTVPEEADQSRAVLDRLLTGEKIPPYERNFRRINGVTFPAEINVEMVHDDQGLPLYIQSIVRDITRRKAAEKRLRAYAESLERSNRELLDYAHVASHDLQEPLRKIQTIGSRLAHMLRDQLTGESREYLNFMLTAAQRMQMLINDFLEISSIYNHDYKLRPTDLDALLGEVCAGFDEQLEQMGASVQIMPLGRVMADSHYLRMVFEQLFDNSIKFASPQRPLRLRVYLLPIPAPASEATPAGQAESDRVALCFSDNGIGFHEKHEERIFQIFRRLHTSEAYPGTGAGLTICRKIIEGHGGRMYASAQPEQGATFFIELPTIAS